MTKRAVRLTIQPDRVVHVEGPEYVDLLRQGLVVRERPVSAPERPVEPLPAVIPPYQTQEAPEPPEPVSAPAEAESVKSRRSGRRAGNRNQEK